MLSNGFDWFVWLSRTEDGHGRRERVDRILEGTCALANFIKNRAENQHEERQADPRYNAAERPQHHLFSFGWGSA